MIGCHATLESHHVVRCRRRRLSAAIAAVWVPLRYIAKGNVRPGTATTGPRRPDPTGPTTVKAQPADDDDPAHTMHRENDPNSRRKDSSNVTLSWRTEPSAASMPKERSHGIISAKTCYRAPRDGEDLVQKLKAEIRDRSIQWRKKRIGSEQETKFQAFKQVTTYRTWPLQEQALKHRDELMRDYLNSGDSCTEDRAARSNDALLMPQSDSLTLESCSSSSSSHYSADEPKRVLRDPLLSPTQSRVKSQCRREFFKEQRLSARQDPKEARSLFAPALWSMEPRIFSYERSTTGKRSYVVAQLGRFLDKYWRKTDPRARHYYEVIPENTPCRLYLDLEFSKVHNEGLSIDGVADELLNELFCELQAEFEVVHQLQLLRSHVVDLDSSTENKFSRHWIVHLPGGHLFPDNMAVGSFVKNFVSRLSNEQATKELALKGKSLLQDYLFVESSNKNGVLSSCIIDLGVYTRNRLFRLLGSQKFGKSPTASLRLSNNNQFPFPEGFDNDSFHLPAMEKYIPETVSSHHNTETDAAVDFGEALDQAVEKFVGMTDWTLHAEALAMTLVVPMNSSKIAFPVLKCVVASDGEVIAKTMGTTGHNRRTIALSVGASPYPLVDDFVINTLAHRGEVKGAIRAWSVDRNDNGVTRQITYQISRNRYCERIGRAHKSNNIQWTVDFQTFLCTQSCHDPDCRRMNFRGAPVELPVVVKDALQEILFDEELACADEKLLMKNSCVEPSRVRADAEADSSFEAALGKLNLGKPRTPHKLSKPVTEAENDSAVLDDALLEAMINDPELFP